ncbi:MAG: aminomethyl-transferring glycine dehydrogenase [Planctomycetota bacterium]
MPSVPPSLDQLEQRDDFVRRHIGPSPAEVQQMLAAIDVSSLDELTRRAVPASILTDRKLALEGSRPEAEVLAELRTLAGENEVFTSLIGLGYHDNFTPPVVLRNILENPAWYTAYTPYQAEISQGRMEALLNFQQLVMDLTGMQIANASLLDEGTAAAEAMHMCHALQKKNKSNAFWVARDCHPHVIEVVRTRAEPLGIDLTIGDLREIDLDQGYFGMLVGYPTTEGAVMDLRPVIARAHAAGTLVVVASDLLALTVLQPPGEMGADVVIGNSQRFGVPFGFGGPHAAFFATSEENRRLVPGRIIGVSQDARGRPGLRLALQTREQHIRREKATSNICTAQVLLAVMASMYAVYHGPDGLRTIAQRTHRLTAILAAGLRKLGVDAEHASFFDTLSFRVGAKRADEIVARARAERVNLRRLDADRIGLSLDETSSRCTVEMLWKIFAGKPAGFTVADLDATSPNALPTELRRTSSYLDHPVFHRHHSETEMLRYIYSLQEKDLALTKAMIPLGSCTMKLNATIEMIPVTLPGFARIHPFAPLDQARGYLKMIRRLEQQLCEITGFHAVSVQPNAGSQGEYAGLLVIRKYHESRGQGHRNVCLIPSSAHGTNPASAAMAGMEVVVVECDERGNVDLEDLAAKAQEHESALAALMVTYPSTHGVFEETIVEISRIVHRHGGQVYMDGANLNALVGLCRPGEFGPDVAHLNLHKTFCIPHGGGGPGVGPIGVGPHLAPFLPTHSLTPEAGPATGTSAVSSAPWGSAGILPISFAYITLMGGTGLERATQVAILNANYVAKRLAGHYPVLYTGPGGWVAHECIVDVRPLKESAGVTVDDVAKRLIDFGFHAPTMSWPVAGTLMIEPTESEAKIELDRFCDAMIAIHAEAKAIEHGKIAADNNPLKNAPHTIDDITGDWNRPYSREQAAFPAPWVRAHKFWPSVNRVDNAHGDRNFFCACVPVDAYR